MEPKEQGTTPLTLVEVKDKMTQLVSDQTELQQGAAAVEQMSKRSNFYSCLLEIALDKESSEQLRRFAAVTFRRTFRDAWIERDELKLAEGEVFC